MSMYKEINRKVLILKDFITDEEHKALKAWITEEFESGKMPLLPAAGKCYYNCYCIQNRKDGSKEFYSVRDKLIKMFGLEDMKVAGPLGHFTMVMDDGASLGKHVDTGKKHLRFNLVVQKPEAGNVYIRKDSYPMEEKDVCCFFPSEQTHWSDEIVGKRMTCSFGWLVPEDWELKE